MAEPIRFPIRFSPVNRLLFRLFLVPPSASYVELAEDTLRVRMAWAFRARIPRHLISKAGRGKPPLIRITAGAHGWRGRWLVNGSAAGIVDVEIAGPARGFVCGFPVRLKVLSVSLEDPDGFLAVLGVPAG